MSDIWNPEFKRFSRVFDALRDVSRPFEVFNDWPTLSDYQAIFKHTRSAIKPVAQSEQIDVFEDQYEPRVFLRRELQTRLNNWHDFFNAMIWLRFPSTKSILNELHYYSALQREPKSNRSQLENAITLFDECGAIIISSREELLQMIRNHQWKELFVENRASFDAELKCLVFGHATYEKMLEPYVGMTTNAILVHSEELLNADISQVDQFIGNYWKQFNVQSTKDLQPFPLLGVPGWYAENNDLSFYDNDEYFRPKR